MVSLTPILAIVMFVAKTIDYVDAHGYFKIPKCSFTGKGDNSEWVVEIPPVWKGDWDKCKTYDEMLALFKKLEPVNNFKDLRTLLDGNPVYGKPCGHTNPNAKPVPAPTDGKAVFSRPVGHPGKCAIMLDEKVVYQSDDCTKSAGNGIFQPVDYSSCPPGGCMFRFYWLALQRITTKTMWQVYKNCVRLSGPPGGGGAKNVSHTNPSDVTQAEFLGNSNVAQTLPNNDPKDLKKKSNESKDSKKKSTQPPPGQPNQPPPGQPNQPPPGQPNQPPPGQPSNQPPPAEDRSMMPSGEDRSLMPPGGDSGQTPSAEDPSQMPPAEDSSQTPSPSSADTPAMTPTPNSKCKGRRRRRY